jgi:hypothetical protein
METYNKKQCIVTAVNNAKKQMLSGAIMAVMESVRVGFLYVQSLHEINELVHSESISSYEQERLLTACGIAFTLKRQLNVTVYLNMIIRRNSTKKEAK